MNAQQRAQRLQVYGLVQGLSYVVRLNDFKTAQHLRAKLAWVLRRPHNFTKPLHHDLKELFEISGLWVRNVGNRHDSKLLIRRLIRRIVRRAKIQRWRNRRPTRRRLTTGRALARQGPRSLYLAAAPTDKIVNPMLCARRFTLKCQRRLTPLAFGCCQEHTASHEHSLRSNGFFGRC